MEATIIIIGTFAFILGYRYINYLREYMNIRFGIKEKKIDVNNQYYDIIGSTLCCNIIGY